MPAVMGRPPKLNDKMIQDLLMAIRAGNYMETAASFVGISKPSLYLWLKTGALDRQNGRKTRYADFSNAVEKALAEAELRDLATISKAAADGNWPAAAWKLERKFPQRWGRREHVDVNMTANVITWAPPTKEQVQAMNHGYEEWYGQQFEEAPKKVEAITNGAATTNGSAK